MIVDVTKSAGANVWRLLVASFVALPAAVSASVDGNLGEASIGYGDIGGDPNVDAMLQLPGEALPGATLQGGFDTSDCGVCIPLSTQQPAPHSTTAK